MTENEQLSLRITKRYMWWSMGASLIPIPIADLAALTAVQLKMLSEISGVYGVAFNRTRGKAIAGSLIGSVVPVTLSFGTAGSLLKAVPVLGALAGTPAMVAFSAASTWALGKVFVQHFESGGTFLDFNPDEVKEYFKAQYEDGRRMAQEKTDGAAEVRA